MEAKNPEELGTAPNMQSKYDLGLNNSRICRQVEMNNYPILRRALQEGMDPDVECKNTGNILAMAVLSKCVECVKMLVDRGADVNRYIISQDAISFDTMRGPENPNGWTLLMVAVAHGRERLIEALINSGVAKVYKTAKGKEKERFHARAVARLNNTHTFNNRALQLLKPNPAEIEHLKTFVIKGQTFDEALASVDLAAIDAFFILRGHDPVASTIPSTNCLWKQVADPDLSNLLFEEEFPLYLQRK
jgi:ankyrin repeat protein